MRKRRNPRGNGLLLVGVLAVGGLAIAGTQGVGPLTGVVKSLTGSVGAPGPLPAVPPSSTCSTPGDPCIPLPGGIFPGGRAAY